ncbi:orotidine-5'-phosphate decarboxylase [Paucilactobacillus nenjiangensis]|uniref:orotidine-5'-phosphate decarboxylase n=1 Tax=Paucilactobacillus nenjiangensis TaxID=1296540 RepID=UPI003BB670A6
MKRFQPIVALDVPTKRLSLKLLDQFEVEPKPIIKIGMQLFYEEGPDIIWETQRRGFDIFLDLKLHDIPNTVEKGMQSIGHFGVQFTTIHAAGGSEMMAAGLRGLRAGAAEAEVETPKLLAITQLTSTDEHSMQTEQHVNLSIQESVQSYAKLAQQAGVDGVVCSAQELAVIRPVVSDDFLCITPGIRPDLNVEDDQKRTVTPAQARQLGSNGIVVGRPITQSDHPQDAYLEITKEFLED